MWRKSLFNNRTHSSSLELSKHFATMWKWILRSNRVNGVSMRAQWFWRCYLHTQRGVADSWTFMLLSKASVDGGWFIPCAHCSQGTSPKLFEGEKAARLTIKEEKTFQRELFTGHDSGASDVPLRPGSQLQNESASALFLIPTSQNSPLAKCCSIPSPNAFYYHSWDVSTDRSLSPPEVAPNSHRGRSCGGVYNQGTVEITFALLAGTARGERRELPFGKAIRGTLRVWPSRVYMQ